MKVAFLSGGVTIFTRSLYAKLSLTPTFYNQNLPHVNLSSHVKLSNIQQITKFYITLTKYSAQYKKFLSFTTNICHMSTCQVMLKLSNC